MGALASAATAPLRGSRTTTAPVSAAQPRFLAARIWVASARSAEACTVASRDVTRSRPGTGSVRETTPVTRPRASTATTVRPGVPRRAVSYCCSSPARPTRSSATSPEPAATSSAVTGPR